MADLLFLDSNKINNNRYTLDNRISGVYKLLSFVSTNNIYNVNDTNNKIYFRVGPFDLIATLTNGFNDINDLKQNIEDAINNSALLYGTWSVSVDTKTNKFTITSTASYSFTFGTNTNNSSRKLLGFNEEDTSSGTTQISSNPADLNYCKNIFITFLEDDNRNIKGIDFFNASFLINGTGSFGEILRYIDENNFQQYIRLKQVKNLNIRFYDENINPINLNSEYQLVLKKVNQSDDYHHH